jgi:sulfatase modifying factor 1
MFPWGDEPADASRANYAASGLDGPTKVRSYPSNGYGLFDVAGNAWEYVADEWTPYSASAQVNPLPGGDPYTGGAFRRVTTRRVIRGGSWGGAPVNLRVTYRDSHPPQGAGDHVGFRCAQSLPSTRGRSD